nr:uncharacterized protein LOC122174768 isoform X2 [Chrysemys picta bellii]
MAPRLVGHLWRTAGRSCLLLLLIFRDVISTQCQSEPTGAGVCPHTHCSVSSGDSLHVPLHLPTTLDLYKMHNSTPTWDHVYTFINGTSHKLLRSFQGQVSVSGGNFTVQDVRSGDGGVYKFQDLDVTCLAWLHLTVLEPVDWRWYLLFLIPVSLVLTLVGWKLKDSCQ